MDDATQRWLNRNKPICICCGVKQGVVEDAIDKGAHTISDVNQRVGTGRGSCGGRRCGPKIAELIDARNKDSA